MFALSVLGQKNVPPSYHIIRRVVVVIVLCYCGNKGEFKWWCTHSASVLILQMEQEGVEFQKR